MPQQQLPSCVPVGTRKSQVVSFTQCWRRSKLRKSRSLTAGLCQHLHPPASHPESNTLYSGGRNQPALGSLGDALPLPLQLHLTLAQSTTKAVATSAQVTMADQPPSAPTQPPTEVQGQAAKEQGLRWGRLRRPSHRHRNQHPRQS